MSPTVGSDHSGAKLVRGAEAPRADEVIAAYVTHSPQPRLVTISRPVFGHLPRTRSNRTIQWGDELHRLVPVIGCGRYDPEALDDPACPDGC